MRLAIKSVSLVFLLLLSAHASAMFSALYVVGDSLSDSGNAFLGLLGATEPFPYTNSVPAAPYAPDNVFSNGNVWVQYVADDLNLPLEPSFNLMGGTNFALGGARTGALTFGALDFGLTFGDITGQSSFAAGLGTPPAGSLHIVNGGGNDVRLASQLVESSMISEADALAGIGGGATNLANAVATLVDGGAEHIVVSNVPDVGRTPDLIGQGVAAAQFATDLSVAFNLQLVAELADVRANNPGIDIITLDTFALTNALLDNPGSLNVTDACTLQNGGNGCADPDSYVFWDGIHPTTATHRLSADAVLQALVPIPAAVWLFGSAFVALCGISRRHPG